MNVGPDIVPRTLIDELLAEQHQLSAVETFAIRHERSEMHVAVYRALLPASAPGPDEQYAFEVNLDSCTSCKACVSACHSLNGLEEDEIWRNVGLIRGGTIEAPYQQSITTACHHCVEPGCLEGCPVGAYEKDDDTGIVRHLDDQCIGCQYCVLKCPYEVPQYSKRLGIVRKCDMCSSRLAVGEAPACVQACPNEAISIRVVNKTEKSRVAVGAEMVPGAFDSSYTKPTTNYLSEKTIPSTARPADAAALALDHPHWPLIGMLVFTQMGAGLAWLLTLAFVSGLSSTMLIGLAAASFLALHAGLGVSVLHLGRPLGAWRFFLGLRTSWMSREILAFLLFSMASGAPLLCATVPVLQPLGIYAALGTSLLAAVAVFTSAMIYIDTRRPSWLAPGPLIEFFGTALLLGCAGTAAVLKALPFIPVIGLPLTAVDNGFAGMISLLAAAIAIALAARTTQNLMAALRLPMHPSHMAARCAWYLCRPFVAGRIAALILGGVLMVFAPIPAMVLLLGAEIAGRYLFFTASAPPRMPGMPERHSTNRHS